MGVLKPSGNGLYLLDHKTLAWRLPSRIAPAYITTGVILSAKCELVLW
jgi:hypothetical protein